MLFFFVCLLLIWTNARSTYSLLVFIAQSLLHNLLVVDSRQPMGDDFAKSNASYCAMNATNRNENQNNTSWSKREKSSSNITFFTIAIAMCLMCLVFFLMLLSEASCNEKTNKQTRRSLIFWSLALTLILFSLFVIRFLIAFVCWS